MPHFPSLLIAMLILGSACSSKDTSQSHRRQQAERAALPYLNKAREALREQNFAQARLHIQEMRKSQAYALSARSQGILLMDSIDLIEAQSLLLQQDSLLRIGGMRSEQHQEKYDELVQRVKFYQRKIHHDKQQSSQHDKGF